MKNLKELEKYPWTGHSPILGKRKNPLLPYPSSNKKREKSELVVKVATYLDADKDEVLSGNRKPKNCRAQDQISFIASKSMGYKFNEITGILDIYPVTAGRCAEKGKKLVDDYEEIWDALEYVVSA